MKLVALATLLLVSRALFASDEDNLRLFLSQLSKLEFEKAKQSARKEPNHDLSTEMLRLADILSNAGQTDRPNLEPLPDSEENENLALRILRKLEKGYVSLFYDQVKGDAYREFYS